MLITLTLDQLGQLVVGIGALAGITLLVALIALAKGLSPYHRTLLSEVPDLSKALDKVRTDLGRLRSKCESNTTLQDALQTVEDMEQELEDQRKETALRFDALDRRLNERIDQFMEDFEVRLDGAVQSRLRSENESLLAQVDEHIENSRYEIEKDWESLRDEMGRSLREARDEMETDWESLREEFRLASKPAPRYRPASAPAVIEEIIRRAIPDDPKRADDLVARLCKGAETGLRGMAAKILQFCDHVQTETQPDATARIDDEDFLKALREMAE